MLQTVEAEVGVDGSVRLLEPLLVTKPSRALVTLLPDELLRFLPKRQPFETAYTEQAEIETRILEAQSQQ